MSPEVQAAAEAILQAHRSGHYFPQRPRSNPCAQVGTPADVQAIWRLRGLEEDYDEVDCELQFAHEAHSRWQRVQRDLLALDDAEAELFILDYCPEISPDEVARVKREISLFGVADFEPTETTQAVANMLDIDHADMVGRFSRTCVQYELGSLAAKIATLTHLREKLRKAVLNKPEGEDQS